MESTPTTRKTTNFFIFEIKQKLRYNRGGRRKIMEYKYTINQISERVSISKPSLYALIKKNQSFIDNNSVRRQRKIYYNQAVMDFFISYYHPEQVPEEGKIPSPLIDIEGAEVQAENPPLKASYTDKPQEREKEVLQAKIDALQAEIDALRKQLEEKEAEKKELFHQNSQLLLLLQQEKQEKMLLLPAPKKSFSEKVRTFLKNRSHQE